MLIKKVYTPHFCILVYHTKANLKGCCRSQAPRAKPKGQGLQVPPHSHRVPYPPSLSLLQDCWCSPTHLEVRECHCQHPCSINVDTSYDICCFAWGWGVEQFALSLACFGRLVGSIKNYIAKYDLKHAPEVACMFILFFL
jgi:hypothetical protein